MRGEPFGDWDESDFATRTTQPRIPIFVVVRPTLPPPKGSIGACQTLYFLRANDRNFPLFSFSFQKGTIERMEGRTASGGPLSSPPFIIHGTCCRPAALSLCRQPPPSIPAFFTKMKFDAFDASPPLTLTLSVADQFVDEFLLKMGERNEGRRERLKATDGRRS